MHDSWPHCERFAPAALVSDARSSLSAGRLPSDGECFCPLFPCLLPNFTATHHFFSFSVRSRWQWRKIWSGCGSSQSSSHRNKLETFVAVYLRVARFTLVSTCVRSFLLYEWRKSIQMPFLDVVITRVACFCFIWRLWFLGYVDTCPYSSCACKQSPLSSFFSITLPTSVTHSNFTSNVLMILKIMFTFIS